VKNQKLIGIIDHLIDLWVFFGEFELLKFLLEQLDELIVGIKNGENDDKIKNSMSMLNEEIKSCRA
jgi:hypothetical protein